jgi:membrane protease YdiL (CAAX protease family)
MNLAGYYEIAYSTSFFNDAPPISKILLNKVLINTGYGILLGYFRYKFKHLYLPFIIHAIGNIWRA